MRLIVNVDAMFVHGSIQLHGFEQFGGGAGEDRDSIRGGLQLAFQIGNNAFGIRLKALPLRRTGWPRLCACRQFFSDELSVVVAPVLIRLSVEIKADDR